MPFLDASFRAVLASVQSPSPIHGCLCGCILHKDTYMHSGNDNGNGEAGDICDDSYCQHLCEVMPGTSRQPQPEPQNSLPQLTPLMARIIKRHGWCILHCMRCTNHPPPTNNASHQTSQALHLYNLRIHTLPSSSHNFCFLQVALAFAIVKWHPHPHPRSAAVCTKISR